MLDPLPAPGTGTSPAVRTNTALDLPVQTPRGRHTRGPNRAERRAELSRLRRLLRGRGVRAAIVLADLLTPTHAGPLYLHTFGARLRKVTAFLWSSRKITVVDEGAPGPALSDEDAICEEAIRTGEIPAPVTPADVLAPTVTVGA